MSAFRLCILGKTVVPGAVTWDQKRTGGHDAEQFPQCGYFVPQSSEISETVRSAHYYPVPTTWGYSAVKHSVVSPSRPGLF